MLPLTPLTPLHRAALVEAMRMPEWAEIVSSSRAKNGGAMLLAWTSKGVNEQAERLLPLLGSLFQLSRKLSAARPPQCGIQASAQPCSHGIWDFRDSGIREF